MTLKCPICGRPVAASRQAGSTGPGAALPEGFPFCSKRCRMIDLGRWFDGHYRIPGAPVEIADSGAAPDASGTVADGELFEGT